MNNLSKNYDKILEVLATITELENKTPNSKFNQYKLVA
jgi:hypothetical protein